MENNMDCMHVLAVQVVAENYAFLLAIQSKCFVIFQNSSQPKTALIYIFQNTC